MELPTPIPRSNERPDASAQSRLLAWFALTVGVLVLLPCMFLAITETAGVTHLLQDFIGSDGTLTVDVDDPNATVIINGGWTSNSVLASQENSLRPGDYTVTVISSTVSSYQTHTETVKIESGKATVVSVPWTTAAPVDEPASSDDPADDTQSAID